MEPIFELPISVPPRRSRNRLQALHRQLRAAIVEGRLQAGVRLPATRVFAATYGVSRNTAIAAYDLLLSEGYVVARRGGGTFVSSALPNRSTKPPVRANKDDARLNEFWRSRSPGAPERAPRIHFRLGVPELSLFPFDTWRRLSARALRTYSKTPVSGYDDPRGRLALREAISKHVSFTRAVSCEPDDIVITAGAKQAFDLIARILVTPGRTVVALENPGYRPPRLAFEAAGAKIVPVPVDEEGIVVSKLPANARIICVTPSHQYPTGAVMSARRRTELLAFARAHQAVIMEDDYDSEFRFGDRPLDALQTLDRSSSVFYVGTFSKSLFPALRIGFIVAPEWARTALAAAKQNADGYSAIQPQETLAAFIHEGHLARHVRRMRRVYDDRRSVLLERLDRDFPWLQPIPAAAGLHLAALAAPGVDVDAFIAKARESDVGIEALRIYQFQKATPPGVLFGYGALGEAAIVEGLGRLRRISVRSRSPA
jgi:GntR family transcriptional regulator/MocR family aminotransferase